MNAISQHTALVSLSRALVPGATMIDGRDEKDMLAFLSGFAGLIQFYDQQNNLSGNWRPFLLKDPVFLTAVIAKTPFSDFHRLYLQTCSRLESNILNGSNAAAVSVAFNQLFDQSGQIYLVINEWLTFMQRCSIDYPLSRYVYGQVHDHFSPYFWAMRGLRTAMSAAGTPAGIFPPSFSLPPLFDEPVWTDKKDKQPYWDILGLDETTGNNNLQDFYGAITAATNKLFVFFHTIIRNAPEAYEALKLVRSPFPDTTLLRVFTDLLDVQRREMNGLAEKHLDFYYRDILKQQLLPAEPDSAYVYATLSKPGASFLLPAGTALNAGLDAQKNPVVFSTDADVVLNTADFISACTLSALADDNSRYRLYLNAIDKPGTLATDKNGKTVSWNSFGGSKYEPAVQVNLGFALASPLLLLREGIRTITFNMTFGESPDMALLENADYFLSTPSAWLDVTQSVSSITAGTGNNTATIVIVLEATQPAIEAFVKNPDGLGNTWPMFKMVYGSLTQLGEAPLLKSLTIGVEAEGLQTLQLYNDYGALSTKTPYPLFGPTPMPGNSFIVGSDEVFSKPFTAFALNLEWDQLPTDFEEYYAAYNSFLVWEETVEEEQQCLLKRLRSKIAQRLSGKKPTQAAGTPINTGNTSGTTGDDTVTLFGNEVWEGSFSVLTGQQWMDMDMEPAVYPATAASSPPTPNPLPVNYLFVYGSQLQQNISFVGTGEPLAGFSADPSIQNSPLKFTDTSTSGFMKMSLGGTDLGFGSGIYAGVVSYIALQNASIIVNKETASFMQPANLPYVPRLASCSVSYSASHTYTFDYGPDTYPVQCYFYTPFSKYLVYDNTQEASAYAACIGTSLTNPQQVRDGVPLYAAVENEGMLFLGTQNLAPAASMSIYFDLARQYVPGTASLASPDYFCLCSNGWQQLPVYADSTNHFSCTGVVTLGLAENPTSSSPVMPQGLYWFSAAVSHSPASYSATSFLKTNGLMATRTGTEYLADMQAPVLAAGSITKPVTAIPQLGTLTQPFASFGGKAAETGQVMHLRVSNRIKTKDRAVSREDYYRLVMQQFPEMFYVKTLRGPSSCAIRVLLVPKYSSAADPNAFTPMASSCTENKIRDYLLSRCDGFAQLSVSGFFFQYVMVSVSVSVKQGYTFDAVQQNVSDGINLFLSPWVSASQAQLPIGSPVTRLAMADFISHVPGVDQLSNLVLSSFTVDPETGQRKTTENVEVIEPQDGYTLLVPYTHHAIHYTASV